MFNPHPIIKIKILAPKKKNQNFFVFTIFNIFSKYGDLGSKQTRNTISRYKNMVTNIIRVRKVYNTYPLGQVFLGIDSV